MLIALNPDEPLPETVVACGSTRLCDVHVGFDRDTEGVAVTHGGVVRLVDVAELRSP